MTPIELSSRWTWAFKFVFPAVWGGLFSFLTFLLFTDPSRVRWNGHGEPPVWGKWLCLGCLLFGGLVFARACRPLKRVFLEGSNLRISNYFREVMVPIDQIRESGFDPDLSVGINGESRPVVGLAIGGEKPFGGFVEFIPRSRESVNALRVALGQTDPVPDPDADARENAEEFRGRGTV